MKKIINYSQKIDTMIREGVDINKILKYTDTLILKKGFGFSDTEIKIVNDIWKKMLKRRLGRTKIKCSS